MLNKKLPMEMALSIINYNIIHFFDFFFRKTAYFCSFLIIVRQNPYAKI